ncbi:DesA family fatty acid desaturase [Frateuria aurantia]|uniref:Fatty-acid desaturase n=1 Tax=Frateuria aurantia (strain ATCC 33424 / DSM 6220 / KCTC 2777 / LMG 1558 / NBRC 3245 / NCIMB 13370) TaxID=767434 RepID=H8L243_FRAAD|nr:fatty acid desaturase [Frateuria aurantia]AFC87551.1 fatty-acid desaturase [Frateuria aurantia DSM 6220]
MLQALLNFLAHGLTGASWVGVLIYALVVTQLTIFSVTMYLHRSQTHRGVDFHPAINHAFRFWLWLSTGMITKEWVGVHRKHHARVDTAEDPHSPQYAGIKKVFWDGVSLYRNSAARKDDMEKYGRGTPDDWVEKHVYTGHAMLGIVLMAIINISLFGVLGVAVWAAQMAWIPFWAAGFVNGLGHWWGYRNFESDDKSTNLFPWAFWIGGEELHNNHHAFPSSARFSMRKWEFDIGWFAIRTLETLKLAKVLRVAPTLDIRPNVNLPDAETLKAVLTHRVQAMTEYYRTVIVPTLREEAGHAGDSLKAVPGRLRRALANGGHWLDGAGTERMQSVLAKRPTLQTVCEYRQRLAQLLELRGAEQLKGLQQWVHEAEQSGIQALHDFAVRLKSYKVKVVGA